jgi:DNA-binding SARP family transcriptional activator
MGPVDSVRVRLLGELTVEGCEAASLGRRQTRTLLKVLALHHGHAVSTDQLSDCLWGDEPPARAADQVSILVNRLRAVLGIDRIHRSDAGYTLRLDWLDVDALSQYCDEAERRLGAGALGAARAAAHAGLALVRGPLLADETDPWWAEAERARVHRRIGRMRHVAGTAALAAGDGVEAALQAKAALSFDPFDEAALRLQMQALAQAGRPGSALAAYAAFRSHLGDELGVPPSPETEELHDAVVLGTYQPAARRNPAGREGIDALPGRGPILAEMGQLLDRTLVRQGQFPDSGRRGGDRQDRAAERIRPTGDRTGRHCRVCRGRRARPAATTPAAARRHF